MSYTEIQRVKPEETFYPLSRPRAIWINQSIRPPTHGESTTVQLELPQGSTLQFHSILETHPYRMDGKMDFRVELDRTFLEQQGILPPTPFRRGSYLVGEPLRFDPALQEIVRQYGGLTMSLVAPDGNYVAFFTYLKNRSMRTDPTRLGFEFLRVREPIRIQRRDPNSSPPRRTQRHANIPLPFLRIADQDEDFKTNMVAQFHYKP